MCPECRNNLFVAGKTFSLFEEKHPHSDGSTTYSLNPRPDAPI